MTLRTFTDKTFTDELPVHSEISLDFTMICLPELFECESGLCQLLVLALRVDIQRPLLKYGDNKSCE